MCAECDYNANADIFHELMKRPKRVLLEGLAGDGVDLPTLQHIEKDISRAAAFYSAMTDAVQAMREEVESYSHFTVQEYFEKCMKARVEHQTVENLALILNLNSARALMFFMHIMNEETT